MAGIQQSALGGVASRRSRQWRFVRLAFPFLLACMASVTPSLATAAATTLFGVGPAGFHRIDAAAGTSSPAGSAPVPVAVVARDEATGRIYSYGGTTTKYFGYWTPSSGTTVQIASYPASSGLEAARMDIAPDGTLYLSDVQERLYTLDKSSGAVTLLGAMSGLGTGPYGATGDMAFAPDGTLWMVNYRSLYTLDLGTLQATAVYTGMIGGLGANDAAVWSGLAYCEGELYGSSAEQRAGQVGISSRVIRIDPATGQESVVLDPGTRLNDLSGCLDTAIGNTAPVAQAQSLVNGVDAFTEILLGGSDAENDPLTFQLLDLPPNGTLTGGGQSFSYRPDAGFVGEDSFTFTVSDGQAVSDVATVTLRTVVADPSDIVFYGANAYGSDQLVEINVTQDYSYQVDALPFGSQAIARDPDSGRVYFYEWEYAATRFAYWDPSTRSVTVVRTYSPPNGFYAKRMDFAPDGTLYLSDDAEGLYTIDPSTGNLVYLGQLTGLESGIWEATGDMAFAPDGTLWINNYRGLYTVDLNTLVATEVHPDMIGTVAPGGGAVWTGLAYCDGQLYGSALEFDTQLSPIFSIDPDTGFETFLFYSNSRFLNDLSSCNEVGTPANGAPLAFDQAVSTTSAAELAVVLEATDPDGDPLSYSIVGLPTNGVLSGSGSTYLYTSAAGFVGSDSFTFVANDGQLGSNLATVSITVDADEPLNSPPVAFTQSVTTDEGVAVSISLSASDDDGDALTFEIVSGVGNGSLTGAGGNYTYVPDPGFSGADNFEFRANDGEFYSNGAFVMIQVNEAGTGNEPPVAGDQSVSTLQDAAIALTLTGSDADGDALSYRIVEAPLHGTLSGGGANYLYTPDVGFTGLDGFRFVVNDGQVDSAAAFVDIDVLPASGTGPSIFGAGTGGLFGLDFGQGTATFDGPLPITSFAIARDAPSGEVYFYGGTTTKYFGYWTPSSGTTVQIASYPASSGLEAARMDIAPDGTLYLSDVQERLYTLDKSSGAVTLLGAMSGLGTGSYGATGDMAFAPDGTLWMVNYRSLYTLDLGTLQATAVYTGMIGGLGANDAAVWSGLAYCEGELYGSSAEQRAGQVGISSRVIRIDPATGQESVVLDPGTYLRDLTSCS